jgi:hypothetical protein
VAVCVALLALLAGCGKDAPEPGNLPDALGYIPRDAHVVRLMPTDLDGDQWRRFGHLVEPELKESEFSTVRENIAASIPDARGRGIRNGDAIAGTPAADVRTSGDVVEGDLTIPVPGGL